MQCLKSQDFPSFGVQVPFSVKNLHGLLELSRWPRPRFLPRTSPVTDDDEEEEEVNEEEEDEEEDDEVGSSDTSGTYGARYGMPVFHTWC